MRRLWTGAPAGNLDHAGPLPGHRAVPRPRREEDAMAIDKDRIEGAAEQAKGLAKEVAGKVTGDAKLEAEGKAQKAGGKVQNAAGGVKDALKGE